MPTQYTSPWNVYAYGLIHCKAKNGEMFAFKLGIGSKRVLAFIFCYKLLSNS